jgi:hypothetical protein
LLGKAYMVSIKPFRHLLVYPAMIHTIGREWRKRSAEPAPAGARDCSG